MPEKPRKPKNKKCDATKSGPSPEDLALWESFAEGVRPLGRKHAVIAPQEKSRKIRISIKDQPAPLRSPDIADHPSSRQTDARTAERLKRGELPIDGRIDLHGLTEDTAYRRLTSFLEGHIRAGSRCLLIITGKGPVSQGGGVLRRMVPLWLADGVFGPFILSCTPSPRHLGGTGAYLVLLRRKRAKG